MSSILQSSTTAPGRFGPYGGRYVPETLMVPLFELERAYEAQSRTLRFNQRFQILLKNFAGGPTPLQFAFAPLPKNSVDRAFISSAKICFTPARTKSITPSARLLAVKMGKPRIIAETGAGPARRRFRNCRAHLGLECVVYMGTEDMARQALTSRAWRMLGTQVVASSPAARTLKDAINEAMRDWVTNVEHALSMGPFSARIPIPRWSAISGRYRPRSARANPRGSQLAAWRAANSADRPFDCYHFCTVCVAQK